jgi:TolB-like protein/Tfp pilus assembly protein PilF
MEQVVRFGANIAGALAAAHAKGVIHRDLKPGNIMVTANGIKVLDFGLAKIAGAGEEQQGPETLTVSQAIMGTPAYMAPEQRDGRPCDGRTDVYALGLVLCEMATGNRSQLLTGLPLRLARLIERCLAADPGQRWQSAAEVKLELERLGGLDGGVLALRRQISRRLRLALAGLTIVALATVTWWMSGRWRPAGTHQIQSLAVLPLEDLSGDPLQAYFADGMTEALITDLSKIGSLQVISRSAVMKYRGSHRPAPEIARELKVDAVVEGSVLRAGGRVVITAHLVSPDTNRQLWSDRYERDARDVLELTGDVAQAIAQGISARLTTQERATLARRRPVIPAAYEAYLQGRYYWAKVTDEAVTKGIGFFQQASQIDPSYPLAYSGLADCYIILGGTILGAAAPRDTTPKAKEAALKALSLDDNLAEAHASLAMVLWRYDWDWAGAEREFKRALELNSSYATGRQWYGWYLYGLGRTVESVAEMGQAARLDPQSPWIRSNLGFAYYFARQYDRAIEEYKHTLDMDPNFVLANFFLGLAYEQTRQLGQATAAFEQGVDRSGRSPVYLAALGHSLAVSGKKAEALKVQRELSEIAKRRYVPAYETAVLWDGLGDQDQAIAWLEKGHEEHSGWMVYLDVDPRLDDLHGDSRFQDLVRAVGLPK